MKGKGLGWVLLLGALAVPAVLFFKWWTQMKASQAVEARQAVPAAAPFGGTPAPASEPAAAAPAAPAETAPAVAGAADKPQPEPQAQASAPRPEAAAEPPAAAAQPPPEAPQPPNQPAMLAYMPKTTRDPMLSVADLRALAQERYRKEMSQREVERAAAEPAEKAPSAPPPRPLCETLELQGIIGTSGDISAIVNDKIVREGDSVGGAVVERLTTRTIVFKKGKKTCMKRVSK